MFNSSEQDEIQQAFVEKLPYEFGRLIGRVNGMLASRGAAAITSRQLAARFKRMRAATNKNAVLQELISPPVTDVARMVLRLLDGVVVPASPHGTSALSAAGVSIVKLCLLDDIVVETFVRATLDEFS